MGISGEIRAQKKMRNEKRKFKNKKRNEQKITSTRTPKIGELSPSKPSYDEIKKNTKLSDFT